MKYVWKSSLWIGIFQGATQRPSITDNIQSGGACEEALRRALAEAREKGELATSSLELEFLSYQSANQRELNKH